MLIMMVPQYGSLKAAPSQVGKNLSPCCGSTENVCLSSLCVFRLDNRLPIPQRAPAKAFLRRSPNRTRSVKVLVLMAIGSSMVIQDIERIVDTGSAHMAYFFFDFKDTGKLSYHGFLSSVLVQLSDRSVSFRNVLLELFSAHQRGSQLPRDSALTQSLNEMLKIPGQEPIYVILDGLDECPNPSEVPSSREEILQLVKELVECQLPNLRLYIASRANVDIWSELEPLTPTSNRISLHDEDGHKKDIVHYVSSMVYSDEKMSEWREEDKELVIKALSDRANGVYEDRSPLVSLFSYF